MVRILDSWPTQQDGEERKDSWGSIPSREQAGRSPRNGLGHVTQALQEDEQKWGGKCGKRWTWGVNQGPILMFSEDSTLPYTDQEVIKGFLFNEIELCKIVAFIGQKQLSDGSFMSFNLTDFSKAAWKMNGEEGRGKSIHVFISIFSRLLPDEYFRDSIMLTE